jgi:D-tagatose-1,6-bisphosphate aldolase subunit GatZ/KbaZ
MTSSSIRNNGFIPEMIRAQKRGHPLGLYCICSANRFVLEAAMLQANQDGTAVCIESTPNQVNQSGGYSGKTPAEFVQFVHTVATDMGFPAERIILGGDHLGPHVWQNETSASAMLKAHELVRQSILAGYTKIHLDTSMRCADDPQGALNEEVMTERAADLCQTAEAAFSGRAAGSPPPYYVVGTEVPVPGGEQKAEASLSVTRTEDLERTLELTRKAFLQRGLEAAWRRVIAIVVQAGVDFGDASIFAYDRDKARRLSLQIEKQEGLVFEAHSTDYQARQALKAMVEDHFAILKVGPWLTYAFREAIFALAEIEQEWLAGRKGVVLSQIREALETAMLSNPIYWKNYYHGDETYVAYARKYSYSDRCRYYWLQPEVEAALGRLRTNLSCNPPPLTLLSQYLPIQFEAIRQGNALNSPEGLIRHKIQEVTSRYAYACGRRMNSVTDCQ